MPLITKGFKTPQQRAQHYADHGREFFAANEIQYEAMADRFIGADLPRMTLQAKRPYKNALVRYNPFTNEPGWHSSVIPAPPGWNGVEQLKRGGFAPVDVRSQKLV